MSYESNADGTARGEHPFNHSYGDSFGWAKRPGFNPYKALAVVGGLAIFPPLGIAALVYFIWNEKRFSRGQGQRHGFEGRHGCGRRHGMDRTGNAAFDEHRAKVMKDLEDEQQAFAEHRFEQRRKRDQEAFDAFQAKRDSAKDDGDTK